MTAGTLFQDTRARLTTWFLAMWYVTSSKPGTSARALQQVLGLAAQAAPRDGSDRLSGEVEVDESFVGALGGAQGRSTATKALIVVAAAAGVEVVSFLTSSAACSPTRTTWPEAPQK